MVLANPINEQNTSTLRRQAGTWAWRRPRTGLTFRPCFYRDHQCPQWTNTTPTRAQHTQAPRSDRVQRPDACNVYKNSHSCKQRRHLACTWQAWRNNVSKIKTLPLSHDTRRHLDLTESPAHGRPDALHAMYIRNPPFASSAGTSCTWPAWRNNVSKIKALSLSHNTRRHLDLTECRGLGSSQLALILPRLSVLERLVLDGINPEVCTCLSRGAHNACCVHALFCLASTAWLSGCQGCLQCWRGGHERHLSEGATFKCVHVVCMPCFALFYEPGSLVVKAAFSAGEAD